MTQIKIRNFPIQRTQKHKTCFVNKLYLYQLMDHGLLTVNVIIPIPDQLLLLFLFHSIRRAPVYDDDNDIDELLK